MLCARKARARPAHGASPSGACLDSGNRAGVASVRHAAGSLDPACGAHARRKRGARALGKSAPELSEPITRAAFSGARGTRTGCRPSHTSAITLPCPTPRRAQAREKSHGSQLEYDLLCWDVMDIVQLAIMLGPLLVGR
jgi:hypothetical protein